MDTKKAGQKGGNATKKNMPKDFYKTIGKLGGQATREAILSKFTLEDLENPITAQTVREKLEQLDKLNGC